MTGSHLGGYEILDLIGEGGMGAVYRGRDPRFDRDVAIKVLHSRFQRDPGVVERFKSEAVIQAKLSHPHIVTIFDFVSEADTLAIVMEYVEGLPLGRIIEAKGALSVERALRLMDQILSAMGYAHKRGLVHRDIKPSNILVQSIEGQEYAKVMDFGIAKILGSEKLRTATGAKMGTLAYMSPEHVRSPKNVDARSDVYSLGVVLYEMLTGHVPFDADSEYELMRQIVEDEPRELRSPGSSLPEGLSVVVESALAKDPARRFRSCEEMRQALLRGVQAPAEELPARSAALVPPVRVTRAYVSHLGSADQPAPALLTTPSHPPASATAGGRPGWVVPVIFGLAVLVGAGSLIAVMRQRALETERRLRAEAAAELQRERDEAERVRRRLEGEKNRAITAERERQARELEEARRQAEAEAAARTEAEAAAAERRADEERRLEAAEKQRQANQLAAQQAASAREQAVARDAAVANRLRGSWQRAYAVALPQGELRVRESWRYSGTVFTVEVIELTLGGKALPRDRRQSFERMLRDKVDAGASYVIRDGSLVLMKGGRPFAKIPLTFPSENTMTLPGSNNQTITFVRE
jgi:serine/threonine-protein kinase